MRQVRQVRRVRQVRQVRQMRQVKRVEQNGRVKPIGQFGQVRWIRKIPGLTFRLKCSGLIASAILSSWKFKKPDIKNVTFHVNIFLDIIRSFTIVVFTMLE